MSAKEFVEKWKIDTDAEHVVRFDEHLSTAKEVADFKFPGHEASLTLFGNGQTIYVNFTGGSTGVGAPRWHAARGSGRFSGEKLPHWADLRGRHTLDVRKGSVQLFNQNSNQVWFGIGSQFGLYGVYDVDFQ